MNATLDELLDLTAQRRGYRNATLATTINVCCCCSCCCGQIPKPY